MVFAEGMLRSSQRRVAKLKSVEVRTETPMTMESRLVIDMGGTPVAVASSPKPEIEEAPNDQTT
jgi:hypothetical protein